MRRALTPTLTAAALALALCPAAHATPPGPTDVPVRDAEATCRHLGGPCQPEAGVSGWSQTWTHRALAFQYALGDELPLRNAPWVGTHNSFNSIAEMGNTLSDTDSNQQLSLLDQLSVDVRSLELDVHSFAGRQVVCHARGADQGHAGCSVEKDFATVLGELAGWLRDHRDQVLLLYLEDHLDGQDGHDAGAAALQAQLGDLIYRPGGSGCTKLPLTLTRDDVLAAGAQVIIVTGCGTGSAWQSQVFDWSDHVENRPVGYRDFPDCGPDYSRATYDTNLVRYYEDSTALTEGASYFGQATTDDGITPATAAAMARCGVDLIGLDQLLPGDGRLDALVWSWAPGEPAAPGSCAVQRPDGRWESRSCDERHPATCTDGAGGWLVTPRSARFRDAAKLCAREGTTFATPRTGYENALVHASGNGATTWLDLAPA
jgi:hypothetical protein